MTMRNRSRQDGRHSNEGYIDTPRGALTRGHGATATRSAAGGQGPARCSFRDRMPRPLENQRLLFEALRLADWSPPYVEYRYRGATGHSGSHHFTGPRAAALHDVLRGR